MIPLLVSVLLLAQTCHDDKVVTEKKASDQTGKQRLLLKFSERDISDDKNGMIIGRDFHSLVWETNDGEKWMVKHLISRNDFELGENGRRWINDLYSFDSVTGCAIIKVAEDGKPDATGSSQCGYSWREWDLLKNKQVRMIRECKDPFEPYQKRMELPNFSRGDPAVEKALNEARSLAKEGKYEEALQKHIWFHENVPAKAPLLSSVRLVSGLSQWAELGKKYPKAMDALIELRDKSVKKLDESRGPAEEFQIVATINEQLKEQAKTLALFKTLHEKRKDIAYFCFIYVEKDLVAQREYKLCSSYFKDPMQQFSQLTFLRSMSSNLTKNHQAGFRDDNFEDTMFMEGVCRLIEVLEGVDRHEDAVKVQAKAIALIDTPEMRKAISAAIGRAKRK